VTQLYVHEKAESCERRFPCFTECIICTTSVGTFRKEEEWELGDCMSAKNE